jgi:serine phosphatase RsbU (regulator of sigma subunit)
MFRVSDLFQIHQAAEALQEVLSCRAGLVVVAGPGEPTPLPGNASDQNQESSVFTLQDESHWTSESGFLPSGRNVVFRIMAESMLKAGANATSVLVSQASRDDFERRDAWRRVHSIMVEPGAYAEGIFRAVSRHPDLLMVDRLDQASLNPVLEASQRGLLVLSQMETPFRGQQLLRQLEGMGISPHKLAGIAWIISVLRLPALCPECRLPYEPTPEELERLGSLQMAFHKPDSTPPMPVAGKVVYYQKHGCPNCKFSGRRGDVAVVDVSRVAAGRAEPFLSMEYSLWDLVIKGVLPLRDLLNFEEDLALKIFQELHVARQVNQQAAASLSRTRSELQAASRVLSQRNQALFSFQDIGYALIRTDDLSDLAGRICRHACLICGADRAILYILLPGERMEIAASLGWAGVPPGVQLDAGRVFLPGQRDGLFPYHTLPPGVMPPPAVAEQPGDLAGMPAKVGVQRHFASRRTAAEHARRVRQASRGKEPQLTESVPDEPQAGLFLPLIAQEERVGALIIQSMSKKKFSPAETALLQSFANQAALALQRAGLVQNLRNKIIELEAAQVELAEKERMAHEMELARQVQQSVLPQTFPSIPGFAFAARYEAARQVGGDFYDVIELDEHHFGLAIADVSDKGMPAALYMALTRSLLVAQARHELSPASVLRQVNQLLIELSTSDMFVTLFYGVIDKRSRRLSYARAGHDCPMLLRREKASDLEGVGTALGVMASEFLVIQEQQVDLLSGDRLVFFTDGLTDASAPDLEFFGRSRLSSLLQARAGLPIDQLCHSIFAALRDFQSDADQFDDMTMLVIDVL